MLDPKWFDKLAKRANVDWPLGMQAAQEDVKRNLGDALEAMLGRLDLVTREEFDVQSAVLARTRQKLEALEARVRKLESMRQTS